MASRASTAVTSPNLGLYLGKDPFTVPPRAVVDGMNFRVKNGRIQKRNMGWAPFFPTGQENTSATKVLLHFSGSDAGTHIYDSAFGKSAKKAWTVAGNAQLDTAQFKFGPTSLLCDGTGDWVTVADHVDFTLGTTFTVELWFKSDATTGTARRIAGQAPSGLAASGSAWYAERHTDDTIRFHLSNGSAFTTVASTSTFVQGHDIAHLRVTLSGGTLRLFINGTLEASGAFVGSPNNSTNALRVGAAGEETTSPWLGWIDEFAIWNTALSTADFSPPTSPYNTPLTGSNGEGLGPAMSSDRFITRDAGTHLFFFTDRNIYRLVEDQNRVVLMNPSYSTGTVTAAGTALTGVGTDWSPLIKPGDEISFLNAAQNDPDAQWYTISVVTDDTHITLDESVVETVSGAVYTIRRTFSGAADDVWDTEIFVAPDDGTGDDMYFVTNGVDHIATWTAATTFFTDRQTELPFTARFLAVFKSMMLYGNITEDGGDFLPTDFINSDVGVPLDVANGLAGQFRIHDGPDHMRNMEDLGDNMVFYSERTITHMQFVGDPLVFIFREASSGIGLIASRLLADFGDYHEFVGHDSLYKFDGVSVQEIGKQLWREILRLRDPVRHEMSFCHFDEELGELHYVIALTSDAGVGVAATNAETSFPEHYLEEVGDRVATPFSKRSMPFNGGGYSTVSGILSWADLTEAWSFYGFRWNDSFLFSAFPLNLMCGQAGDGRVYTINIVPLADGDALPSFVTFPRRVVAPGQSYAQGLVTRVYPFVVEAIGSMKVTTRYYDHPEGPVVRQQVDEFDMGLPQEGHFVTPYRKGRAYDCQFSTDTEDYDLGGYDAEVRLEGRR